MDAPPPNCTEAADTRSHNTHSTNMTAAVHMYGGVKAQLGCLYTSALLPCVCVCVALLCLSAGGRKGQTRCGIICEAAGGGGDSRSVSINGIVRQASGCVYVCVCVGRMQPCCPSKRLLFVCVCGHIMALVVVQMVSIHHSRPLHVASAAVFLWGILLK